MMENDIHNQPVEEKPELPVAEEKIIINEETQEVEPTDDGMPEGWSFEWGKLAIGVAICYYFFNSHWTVTLFFALVVIVHELGHVVFGRLFGCYIKEMQVFLLSFVSYRPKQLIGENSWRNITLSLGTLPLGGFTVFKTRPDSESDDRESILFEIDKAAIAASPYIDDKPAWQRLLISAGGVLFNLVTFLVLYIVMPSLPVDWVTVCWPLMSLSLVLAVLNILPVYPLDGGSIIFACYEMISGKKPSKKFVQYSGMIGFVIIILFFWVFPQWINWLLDGVFGVLF